MPNPSELAREEMSLVQLLNWMHAINGTLRIDAACGEPGGAKMLTLTTNSGRCPGRAVLVTERDDLATVVDELVSDLSRMMMPALSR